MADGLAEGVALGVAEGVAEGVALGVADGLALGAALGLALGLADGLALGVADGAADGDALGVALGAGVGTGVGTGVGSGVGAKVMLEPATSCIILDQNSSSSPCSSLTKVFSSLPPRREACAGPTSRKLHRLKESKTFLDTIFSLISMIVFSFSEEKSLTVKVKFESYLRNSRNL